MTDDSKKADSETSGSLYKLSLEKAGSVEGTCKLAEMALEYVRSLEAAQDYRPSAVARSSLHLAVSAATFWRDKGEGVPSISPVVDYLRQASTGRAAFVDKLGTPEGVWKCLHLGARFARDISRDGMIPDLGDVTLGALIAAVGAAKYWMGHGESLPDEAAADLEEVKKYLKKREVFGGDTEGGVSDEPRSEQVAPYEDDELHKTTYTLCLEKMRDAEGTRHLADVALVSVRDHGKIAGADAGPTWGHYRGKLWLVLGAVMHWRSLGEEMPDTDPIFRYLRWR